MRNRVFVEIDEAGNVTRIIKSKGGACFVPPERLRELPRIEAVENLRQQVFKRADNCCDKCGKVLSWGTLQMHERVPKSQGGEQSLENCWALCYDCHQGKRNGEHKRHPQWAINKNS